MRKNGTSDNLTTPSSSSKKIPPRSHYPKSSNCWSNIDNAIFKNTDYENEKMKKLSPN